jgi:nicotinamide riboside transporter PnuC
MEFLNVLTWILVLLNVVGIILNNKKDHRCFYIWIPTNLAWCIFNLYHDLYSQSFMFGLYFIFAIFGLKSWKKKEKKNESDN